MFSWVDIYRTRIIPPGYLYFSKSMSKVISWKFSFPIEDVHIFEQVWYRCACGAITECLSPYIYVDGWMYTVSAMNYSTELHCQSITYSECHVLVCITQIMHVTERFRQIVHIITSMQASVLATRYPLPMGENQCTFKPSLNHYSTWTVNNNRCVLNHSF